MKPLIGIFGGTFDPPHLGHLILAMEARSRLDIDRLLWMLTPDPPHKQSQPLTGTGHRLAMVRLAVAGDPQFELSTAELDRPGPHYALDTVKLVAAQNPGADIAYLMGGDSLHDLPTWHRPADLVAALRYVGVMRRPADTVDLSGLEEKIPGLTAKVRFVDAPQLDIASREIRERIAEGRPFRYFLSPAVYDYILKNNLYR